MQACAIIPKIRDVDSFLQENPVARSRIREVHPEVCFYFMAGKRLSTTFLNLWQMLQSQSKMKQSQIMKVTFLDAALTAVNLST